MTLRSVADFVAFLRTEAPKVSQWLRFDDFRNDSGDVDYARLGNAVQQSSLGSRTVYSLRYNPQFCAGFTFRMTNDGYSSLYGCCGK